MIITQKARLVSLTFVLSLLAALVASQNSLCTFPQCVRFRINNCLPTQMRFTGCQDTLGKWVHKPTSISPMGHTMIEISPPGFLQQTIGNCTWEYSNANGTWTAFADWDYAELGSDSFGAGTSDVVNGEITQIGQSARGNQCAWFMYSSMSWDACYVGTNDTECVPANSQKTRRVRQV